MSKVPIFRPFAKSMFTTQRPEEPLQNGQKEDKTHAETGTDDFYYTEAGFMVFTAAYHLKRGYCCTNGCRHCPYGFKKSEA